MTRVPSLAILLFAGLALSFAFPEPSLAPLAWVAIVPLLLIARDSPRRGFALGTAFGVGFFGSLLIWVSVVGWAAWAVLVIMESLFIGLFGAGWAIASRSDRRWWPLIAPALWVTLEALRSLVPVVGFPWGELAQSQTVFPWLLQISQVGGAKTVSVVLVTVNTLVALALLSKGPARMRWGGGAVATIVALVPLSYVVPRIDGSTAGEQSRVLRVAIVQGNASPGVVVEDELARVERHLRLTEQLVDEHIDLVVWPESAVGIDPFEDPRVMAMIVRAARAVDAPMIVGANLETDQNNYNVATLHVSAEGDVLEVYRKTHLVPFGEYLPARRWLSWLPGVEQIPRDAVAGSEPTNFEVGDTEVATVISFEGDFGPLVRDRVAQGARLITVATNTSTWKNSWASAQHLAMSQVRAAETRVPVVHAALSGISAAVGFDGVVGQRTELYTEGTIVFDMVPSADISIYARTGEWLPLLCLVGSLIALFAGWRRRSTVPA
ncbi:MAG: apolipoprotein N-acyltransferase [Actinomycetota bacterium]|jgi:apolipoprotein N-acyltransferase|nr:apolipoprotein N-acyltransferase [Actinomycetota bacterium]